VCSSDLTLATSFSAVKPATASTPYGGTPWAVPGTIQAENYDIGGQNVAYYDTTPGNSGKVYRSDDVDITTSSLGGYCVENTAPGEWLNYTVNVATSGTYVISFSVASQGVGGAFHVNFNGVNATGELQIPNTGFWQTWQTLSTVVNLSAGQKVMQVCFDTEGACNYTSGNLDSICLAAANTSLKAAITAPATANEGSSVTLTGSATGAHGAVSYWWDPANSGTYTLVGSNVSFAFPDGGTYTIRLLACDPMRDTGTATTTISIANVPPTAYAGGPYTVGNGVPLVVQGSATNPSPVVTAAGFTYNWIFGDGTSVIGTTANPLHVYVTAGSYSVSVTATDEDGLTSAPAIGTVNVFAVVPMTVSAGSNLSLNVGSTATFNGTVSGGVAPYTYSWNFGDGTTATGTLTPSHPYYAIGTYSALLSITDSEGEDVSSVATVTVADVVPTVSIAGPPTGNVGASVVFSTVTIDPSPPALFAGFLYNWNFGDGTTMKGTNPTASHAFASPGTYTVSVTATDQNGETSVLASTTIAIAAATLIPINSTWLANNGPAPYLLNQAGATYQLQTDVTANGTAFIVLNKNITLDLNGHTVTYGNSAPVPVTNGGVEQGSGTTVPGWDISQAPAAAVAANTNYLFGNQVLRLTNFSTPQQIVSAPIPIALFNHTYTATTTPGGQTCYGTATLTLSVVDSITGAVLGTGTSSNIERGFSAVTGFTPTTSDPVVLRVDVTPAPGKTVPLLDLDAATLTVSYDYGIVAGRIWPGTAPAYTSFPGFTNFPASVQAAYAANYGKVQGFTIENGKVLQGQGGGYGSTVIDSISLNGLTVNGVQTFVSGMDTQTINATYAGSWLTIANSRFQNQVSNMTNRMREISVLQLDNITANAVVEGNTITGTPQSAIHVSNNNGKSLVIRNNQIQQNTVVTNGYGITLTAVSNFSVTNNTITGSGRGISIDEYTSILCQNGVVQGNYVNIAEAPEREYKGAIGAFAFRLRNSVDAHGPIHDVDISGNTFIATVGPGDDSYSAAAKISLVNNAGNMNNADIQFHDNTLKGIVATTSASYSGVALDMDTLQPGIIMTVKNNVLESNDTSVWFGQGLDVYDLTMLSNTLTKSNLGAGRPYTGIKAGSGGSQQIHNVRILDTQLANGATLNFVWSGTGTKDIAIGWLPTVQALNANGTPVAGATVTVFDRQGNVVYQGLTAASGNLASIPISTTIYSQTGINPASITTDNRGSFSILVTSGSRKESVSASLLSDATVTVTLP